MDGGADAEVDDGGDAGAPCTVDADGDGVSDARCGGRDCDDGDPLIHPGAADPGAWLRETADARGWALHPALAVDAAGIVHVVYEDHASGTVRHASNAGGAWAVETVDVAGLDPDLAIDAQGTLQVAYERDQSLSYARLEAGSWQPEEVSPGRAPSIAVDESGVPWIAALGLETPALLHVLRREAAGWSEVPPSRDGLADGPDDPPRLMVGTEARVRVAFVNGGALRLATWTEDAWTIETVSAAGAGPERPAMRQDAGGTLFIAYHDEVAHALDLAHQDRSGWTVETVDARRDAGASCALALDPAGSAHLLYYAADGYDVRYATDAFGAWVFVTLDRSAESGTTLAIDSKGRIQMAFSTTDSDLQYAAHQGGDGIDQDCSGLIDDGDEL
jgi:hypothetical protein